MFFAPAGKEKTTYFFRFRVIHISADCWPLSWLVIRCSDDWRLLLLAAAAILSRRSLCSDAVMLEISTG